MLSLTVARARAEYESSKKYVVNKMLTSDSHSVSVVLSSADVYEHVMAIKSGDMYEGDANQILNAYVERNLEQIIPTIVSASRRSEEMFAEYVAAGGEPIPADAVAASVNAAARLNKDNATAEKRNGPLQFEPSPEVAATALTVACGIEMLASYIGNCKDADEVAAMIPVAITLMQQANTLTTSAALATQRVLLAAFDYDFERTTAVIAGELTPAATEAIVESLSRSALFAEAIVAIFGSALPATSMMDPMTRTELFTSAWLDNDFHFALMYYLPTAIADLSRYNYFYFLRELLKRGHSHSAGPVVDALLTRELFAPFVAFIVFAAEKETAHVSASNDRRSGATTLTGDAVGVLVHAVTLVRKSVYPPDSVAAYMQSLAFSECLSVIVPQLPALCLCIRDLSASATTDDRFDGVSSANYQRLGKTKLAIMELCTECAMLNVACVDQALVEAHYVETLLTTCRAYPNHDALIRLMYRALLSILTRAPFVGESNVDFVERDVLLRHMLLMTESDSGAAPVDVLGQLTEFATSPDYSYLPLSSFSIDLLSIVAKYPLFSLALRGAMAERLRPFTNDSSVAVRLDAMEEPITGEKFKVKGSAQTGKVVHLPVINHAAENQLDFSLSDRSVDQGRTSSGSSAGSSPTDGGVAAEDRGNGGGDVSVSAARTEAEAAAATAAPPPKLFAARHRDPNNADHFVVRRLSDAVALEEEPPALQAPMSAEDLEAVHAEVEQLRAAGSPQLRAYPKFDSFTMNFTANNAD